MPLGKMNIYGNQQAQMMPQQNPNFQAPIVTGQSNRNPILGRGLQRYVPKFGVPGGVLMPPGFAQPINNIGGSKPGGLSSGMIGGNPAWGTAPQSLGGQGYRHPVIQFKVSSSNSSLFHHKATLKDTTKGT